MQMTCKSAFIAKRYGDCFFMIWGFRISRGNAARALAGLLLTTTTLGTMAPAFAQEAQRGAAVRFEIPAQSLADALALFGRQSGLQVTASDAIVSGKSNTAVRGNIAPAAALSQLLAGTGLTFRFISASSVRIEPAPQSADGAVQLGPVRVEGASGFGDIGQGSASTDPAATEGTRSYAAQAITIGKAPQSLKDTPQSVTVMTRQLIEDQRLDTLSDLMIRTPGLVLTTDINARDIVYSRGFAIQNVQLDGVSIAYGDSRPNVDLAIYDRVEVLRGSDGLFSGTGQPGGTLNLVRKRALKEQQFQFLASGGSWQNFRAEADVTGPLAFDGHLRGRVVGVFQDRDFFYSPGDERKTVLYGVLEADLGPDTVVSAGASYLTQKGATWHFGLPRYEDGGDLALPRSKALTAEWAVRDQETIEYFGSFEQAFGEDWKLTVKASHQDYESANTMFPVQALLSRDDPRLTVGRGSKIMAGNNATTVDVNLTGDFDLFGQRHQIIVGADWQKSAGVDMRYYGTSGALTEVDIFTFDPSLVPAPVIGGQSGGWPAFGARQMAFYAKLQAQVGSSLRVMVGGRYSDYKYSARAEEYEEDGTLIYDQVEEAYREKGIFTPYGALVYAIDDRWSLYGSIAEIHQSQANNRRGPPPGTDILPAIKGRNYEAGIKGSLRDETLNLSLAAYRIERTGQAVEDPQYPWTPGSLGTSCCYIARGKIVSQGIDTEISGEILPGWQIQLGYTYNHNRDKDTDVPYHAMTPEHLFKLWTSFELTGGLSGWTVGGGLTAQSKQFNSGEAWFFDPIAGVGQWVDYKVEQGGYAVANMSVDYRINANWSAAFNLNNVFDKTYYQTIGSFTNGNWYGTPRNFLLTLRGRY